MARDVLAFLWDIQEACERVTRFTHSRDFDQYAADDQLRSAVERQLEIMGEALSQLSKLDPALAGRIPAHRQIISFRNILIHGYAALEHPRIWHEVKIGVPNLTLAVDLLMAELGRSHES